MPISTPTQKINNGCQGKSETRCRVNTSVPYHTTQWAWKAESESDSSVVKLRSHCCGNVSDKIDVLIFLLVRLSLQLQQMGAEPIPLNTCIGCYVTHSLRQ